MIGGRMSPGVLGFCATLLVLVQAGPLLRFPRESEDYPNSDFSNYTANEVCFSDQKVFQRGEEVPNAGPCEECRCEPPSIVCQMLKCPVNNNGCRTIQRPNHCCPDYNCECDYNGQLYNDGERIDLPEDPCQVCYCKGGDVMCTSITCYQRDDCEPKHVLGQCCPKYEDCPIRDMEASNTEDKNVQTRSPNKTMNSNPKKEMQPWLLTKSVPQTSSSLAVPRLGETTTDSGNVIIVSDWLIERKTTEDFETKQTEDPRFSTHQEFIATTQPQKPTQNIEKDSNFEINMQTAKPTSVDEVVFTRIDTPNRIQEETHDSLTTTATTTVGNVTSLATNVMEMKKDFKTLSQSITSNLPSNSSFNYTDEKPISNSKIDKKYSSTSTFYKESERENMSTTNSIDLRGENIPLHNASIKEKADIKVEPTKENYVIVSSTPEGFEVTENSLNYNENKGGQKINDDMQNKLINTSVVTKTLEHFEGSKNLSQSVSTIGDEDRPLEDTLEHLFGLGKGESTEPQETSEPTSTEKYSTEKTTNLQDEQKSIYTTLPEQYETLLNSKDSKDSSMKIKPTAETVKLEEMNHVLNNGLTNGVTRSHLHQLLMTTEFPHGEEESTTYYNPELNVNNQPLQSSEEKSKQEENTTYLPETTTETETSTSLLMTLPKKLNDEGKENVLDNFIEGKPEDTNNYDTITDTTTSKNTEKHGYSYTETSESSKSSNTLGLQLNTKSILNEGNYQNDIQEDSSHKYVSKVNAFTDSTSTTDFTETTTNTLLEIEIILGETNSTNNEFDKSISSQDRNEQDEVVLDLALDEISSENREVTNVNHPPVLELNSHVPFLQIGGDGNSESSDAEYDQTTVTNKIDPVGSFNNKTAQEKEEITQSIQNEDTLNSSFTVTAVEALSSTNKPSKAKVEEFTIPTIAVVPLTPGDLKMIAEYLISEKIKPTLPKNDSTYPTNQWLKGNLTSEENIASILSAANVSIGLMNETNMGRKLETFTKSSASERFEKFKKETHSKSNSILENKSVITSKTDYLHEKISDNEDTFKTTIDSQGEINNGRITSGNLSTEATNDGVRTTVTIPLKEITNRSENHSNSLQNIIAEGTSFKPTSETGNQNNESGASLKSGNSFSRTTTAAAGNNKTNNTGINEQYTTNLFNYNTQNENKTIENTTKNFENVNIRKLDNLETRHKEIKQVTSQIISRLPVSDENPSEPSNTNKVDTTTSQTAINKPSYEGIHS